MSGSISITINRIAKFSVSFDLAAFARQILDLKNVHEGEFHFNFVDDHSITEINKKYLRHNYSTDIITFNLAEDGEDIVGDIYISVDEAKKNAGEFGNTFDEEIRLLVVHGILHLLDYDDSDETNRKAMEREQERLLKKAR